jgi:hypothetical protein
LVQLACATGAPAVAHRPAFAVIVALVVLRVLALAVVVDDVVRSRCRLSERPEEFVLQVVTAQQECLKYDLIIALQLEHSQSRGSSAGTQVLSPC